MDQKRPESNNSERDVYLNENNNNKSIKKVYRGIMNCAAPLLTVVFIAGSICWAEEIRYGDSEEYDADPDAVAVLLMGDIDTDLHIETRLPAEGEISSVVGNSGAELVEAYGVYVDNEFMGAVVNGENIEEQLDVVLEGYKSDDSIIEADYAVDAELKQGVYRSAALVSPEDMTDYLTGEREVVKEYTACSGDTPEKLADDFDMTVDEIKELNPEIAEIAKIETGEALKVKESVPVLPVKYTCEVTEEEPLDYEVLMRGTGEYYSGEEAIEEAGEIGRKVKQYTVTYVGGEEVSRELTKSETVFEPVLDEAFAENIHNTHSIIPKGDDTEAEEADKDAAVNVEGKFMWPVNGGHVSDPFMSDRSHKGMDIAAGYGTDIYAADGGTVIEAGWTDWGYGNFVAIDHGNGYVTLYGHASEVYAKKGQTVNAGDVIAAVGSTGDSTGNHCHFEVMYNGNYLNPTIFIGEDNSSSDDSE